MPAVSTTAVPVTPRISAGSKFGDRFFHGLTIFGALFVGLLILLVVYELYHGGALAIRTFGWKFLIKRDWDPVNDDYGALPFIYGTVVTSAIALLIAVPLSVGTAIYLTDLAPVWLRQPLVSIIEMLAAVPSVIWGLWGIFVLIPWLRVGIFPFLQKWLGFLPIFQGPIFGISVLTAGIIVAIMILPIVTSVSREILRSVPNLQREAAYALGATRWEVTRIAVLSYARRGIFGAAVLGLGRALGETMAVTMVIGNNPDIAKSLFAPGATLASVIANEFTEANTDLHLSVLFELGLVLIGLTIAINIVAQFMIRAISSPETRRVA